MDKTSTPIESSLIKNCIAGDRKSQKRLYEILSPAMFSVCLKFFRKTADAEDVLQEGFIKLFKHLSDYRGDGSFEGWVRRIFVNTAIQYYRNQKPFSVFVDEYENQVASTDFSALEKLYEKDIIHLSTTLSQGYQTVFNLYAVNGYSHKQISNILGITESTSKSQYLRAKSTLRERIGKRA